MARRSVPRALSSSDPQHGYLVPVRTCVGCRDRSVAAGLLRVVAVEGELIPDPRHRHPGRGAHLHPDQECFTAAVRRRAFERALRVSGQLDVEQVRAWLRDQPGPPARPAP